ncbi:hypothetical protein CONCODRAFT_80399 [Conidiobolus coronatus NRRL 28638]|uniref:Ubiquinol-cytochrome c chaperone domain-containing protein n=1 Tax=Conidiobolus coronatus (strain ATCC 28846 / CBS 209.66 / NRRL 28638) TaxID=796925 RepID=A0A137NVD7_CONC2|nr:hypothetical protein CONCODRAFT_80399 [Conidiobolus coronatus NRRL 28638]|eukprot:KXN66770.1 hypothetical protein CONCODRAFT_80399 [Conidiobolus coronatus NRRL 28638]
MRTVLYQSLKCNLKNLNKNLVSGQRVAPSALSSIRYQSTSSNNETSQTQKAEETKAEGENKHTFMERLVMSLKLDKIPQAVLNRQCFPIFETCSEIYKRDKEFYTETLNMPDNFQTWVSVTQLHIWLTIVRLRMENDGQKVNQYLVNVFFHLLEEKIRETGISSDRIIKNSIKDFIVGFRGSTIAFDEGMCKDDAVLAAALWRNMLSTVKGDQIDTGLAYLVRYVRMQLKYVESIPSDQLKKGDLQFPKPEAIL